MDFIILLDDENTIFSADAGSTLPYTGTREDV